MLAKVCSAAANGVEAYPLEVEVNAGYGDTIIGLSACPTPDGEVPGEPGGTPRDIQRYLGRISGPPLDRQLWT
ncbi:MAG: hypothetical protein ACLQM8_18545 [Limisphaerales bacterium]